MDHGLNVQLPLYRQTKRYYVISKRSIRIVRGLSDYSQKVMVRK